MQGYAYNPHIRRIREGYIFTGGPHDRKDPTAHAHISIRTDPTEQRASELPTPPPSTQQCMMGNIDQV